MDAETNQQEGSSTHPLPPNKKKRKEQGQETLDNATKKKRIRTKCSADGCTNIAVKGGVCIRHGASWKKKTCSHDGCDKQAVNNGVCGRHGAKRYTCSHEGCTSFSQKGGVCTSHGAKRKTCSHEGCTSIAKKGGVCMRHGGAAKQTRKICSYEGCTNQVKSNGVCVRHGAKRKTCSNEGCTKQALNNGVCVRHGAKKQYRKTCSHKGCTTNAYKGGLCYRHRDKSKSDSGNGGSSDPLEKPTAKVTASQPDLFPIPVPSLCMSSNIDSVYNKDTDDEEEGLDNYKTEKHLIKKEYNEVYELETDDESGVEKVPV